MRGKIALILLVLVIFTANFVYSRVEQDVISVEVEFQEPQIVRSSYSPEYSHIEMEGTRSLGKVGEPVLPVKGISVLLPPNKRIKDIEIIYGEKITLDGRYLVEPGQKEYHLSEMKDMKIIPDKPKPEIYEAGAPYPAISKKLVSIQNKLGYPLAIIKLFPVVYNPKEQEISYYKKMTVLIKLESEVVRRKPSPVEIEPPKRRTEPKIKQRDREIIHKIIDNKEDITIYEKEDLSYKSGSRTLNLARFLDKAVSFILDIGAQEALAAPIGPIDVTKRYD
ncbi:MAG: C25 family peptidase propeptide domain-containing protein [Candidatus Omnitrophota bacterium]